MTTAIRLLATSVGYIVIVLWLLGIFGIGDFLLTFRVKQ